MEEDFWTVRPPVPNSVRRQAEKLRLSGNEYYKKNRFGAAIDAYTEVPAAAPTHERKERLSAPPRVHGLRLLWVVDVGPFFYWFRVWCMPPGFLEIGVWEGSVLSLLGSCRAIVLNPDVAVSWSNRANCFRKKKDWARVEEDCRKAIELDSSSFKAHHLLGLALLKKKEYAKGIRELERAIDLGNHVNPEDCPMEEILQNLAKAKYLLWEQESGEELVKLRNLREACESALNEQHINKCHLGRHDEDMDEAAISYKENMDNLSKVFDNAEIAERQGEVPDHLCCKISFEIYRDPVITPSGITYERSQLLDHLRKVGHFDPTTREPLEQHQLIPNLAIKEAVRAFLDQNGWAYKSMEMPAIVSD